MRMSLNRVHSHTMSSTLRNEPIDPVPIASEQARCRRKIDQDGRSAGEGDCGCAPSMCALAGLQVGESAVIRGSTLEADGAALLRAMGLRPSARVTVRRRGEPYIVEVGAVAGAMCRIGLARPLAERVMVEVMPAATLRRDDGPMAHHP